MAISTHPMRAVAALILGSLLIVACYFFVDRPVAWFMHDHRCFSNDLLLWPPRISDCLGYAVVAAIIGIAAWRIWRPGGREQLLLVAIAANLVVTYVIKTLLKRAFGRTWPETWIDNNPSLISNGVYGFNPFHAGRAYQSFPSGHAAATFAVISILWLSRPRERWLHAVVGGTVCVALVGLNYHFVGDVIAGAMLGSGTGIYASRVFRLRPVTERG